jgi:hypothetical protein
MKLKLYFLFENKIIFVFPIIIFNIFQSGNSIGDDGSVKLGEGISKLVNLTNITFDL